MIDDITTKHVDRCRAVKKSENEADLLIFIKDRNHLRRDFWP